jgi:FHA domain
MTPVPRIVAHTSSPEMSISPTPPRDRVHLPPDVFKFPAWATPCVPGVCLEVVRRGVELENLSLAGKPSVLIGRIDICDVVCAHASVSRYHAILVFGECYEQVDERGVPALYVYDLDSTHGTRLNRKRVPTRTYVPCFNGDHLCWGESSRCYVVSSIAAANTHYCDDVTDGVVDSKRKADEKYETAASAAEVEEETKKHRRSKRADVASARRTARYDGFQGKLKKRDRMRAEVDAIQAKQHIGPLTDGQRRQVGVLETRLTKVEADIDAETEALGAAAEDGDWDINGDGEHHCKQARRRLIARDTERAEDDIDDARRCRVEPCCQAIALPVAPVLMLSRRLSRWLPNTKSCAVT